MKYKTILADPPWTRSDAGNRVTPTTNHGDALRFPTMKEYEIAALDVPSVCEDAAHLWLWTLNSTMEQALRIVRAWDFTPMTMVTWCKDRGFRGAGLYFWPRSEQLLFAKRGKPAILPDTPASSTWYDWPVPGKWAKKPPESYDLIEYVSSPEYLELFARQPREGWHVWGNEVESDVLL